MPIDDYKHQKTKTRVCDKNITETDDELRILTGM